MRLKKHIETKLFPNRGL